MAFADTSLKSPRSLKRFNLQCGMRAGQRHPKPDKGEERVWQPVHPGDTPFLEAAAEVQIEPNVEELVRANPRNLIGLETSSFKATLRDVVVALEWGDAPPKWTLGNNDA
jgi:hypothetical protein